MLNQRRQQLLRTLLSCRRPLTVAELCQELGLSPRRVRYDLRAIAGWLADRGAGPLHHQRQGFWIEPSPETQHLADELAPRATYDYVLSPEERIQFLLVELLRADAAVSIRRLAEPLYVSWATVYKDLQSVEAWLAERGLRLVRRQSAGVRVVGGEAAWRAAVRDLLGELMDEGQLAARLLREGAAPVEEPGWSLMARAIGLLPEAETRILASLVRETEPGLGFTLADSALAGLVVHLALAVQRLRSGKGIAMPEEHLARLRERREWEVARGLASRVEAACGVTLPEAEVGYITLHLLGARVRVDGAPAAAAPVVDPEHLRLAEALVRHASAALGLELHRDQDLILGLALHLKPIAYRLRFGLPIHNPLLEHVRETYPSIYRAAEGACALLAKAWQVAVPPSEVGYVAMHLGAGVERLRVMRRIPARVLVVCGSGIGTSRLLARRIEAELPGVQIVGFASVLDAAQRCRPGEVDLVVTTVPADVPVPAVQVSPLLTPGDVERVRAALPAARAQGEPTNPALKGRSPVLSEVLTPDTIALNIEASSWEDAVRAAGNLLVRAGAAEPRYVDAMVRTATELGPYIVIGPGVALPHARPEDGSRAIRVGMVRLRRPVPFGSTVNDPVDLVFAMTAVDAESHLRALMELSQLLSRPEDLQALRAAGTPEEAARIIAGRHSDHPTGEEESGCGS